ncbi:MAG: hypothetical protein HYV26_07160 [Candidatus Hydrogenedentes bacterium]|nr:hypothetical protein [Candidatus Hydrogenedentota bacterium]
MTKARILTVLALLAVFGVFGGIYQFYFKEKLEVYSRDQELLLALDQAYSELNDTFAGYKPQLVTQEWSGQRQPWQDAVTDRTTYFKDGGWYVHERIPENVPILRFWYDEAVNKSAMDAYQRMQNSMGYVPFDVFAMFGVPRAEEYAGYELKRPEANKSLGRMSYGISAVEMLLDAKATRVDQVSIWPHDEKPQHNGLLVSRTVGLAFSMTMENLVKFFEKLRQDERYFSVDALQIDWPYIAYQTEPQPQVRMLLTQAVTKRQPQQAAPAGATAAAGATGAAAGAAAPPTALSMRTSAQDIFKSQGFDRSRATKVEEPGAIGKAWKWFKRFYLGTN